MFWKKKNKPEKKFKAPEDPRQAFRVAPDPENPVSISLLDQTLELIEISSGGVAFKNEGLKENSSHMVEFILPPGRRIKTRIKVLRIDEDDICRCNFVNLDPESEDAIHRYVLFRQKEELRFKNL